MKKLVIHQPTNHHSKRFRYYNIFFDNLINRISMTNDVVTDRYRKEAHMGHSDVRLELIDGEHEQNISSYECEMIIENLTDDEIYIFSVADDLTSVILNLKHQEKVKKVFVSQFLREKIFHHVPKEFQHKYFPWIYFPSNEFELDTYYSKRKQITEFDKRMYFRGSTGYRPILNYFPEDVFFGGGSIGSFDYYVEELMNFNLSLSIAGRGEFCYRDVECMALGVPLIRFEYLSEMYEKLIPNFHYVSVDRPNDFRDLKTLDREGNLEHANMIIERYHQVKDDVEFLNFISENARKYYEKNLSPIGSVNYTLNLLNLE